MLRILNGNNGQKGIGINWGIETPSISMLGLISEEGKTILGPSLICRATSGHSSKILEGLSPFITKISLPLEGQLLLKIASLQFKPVSPLV
jgi:hypothetical protein